MKTTLHGPLYDQRLLAQVRESFGRVVYSHKTHEKQADISFSRYKWQQATLIALTALGSGTFLTLVFGLFGNSTWSSLATSFCALLVSWMSLGAKTFKFDETSAAHRDIASKLWDIRESYISLIADMMSGEVRTRMRGSGATNCRYWRETSTSQPRAPQAEPSHLRRMG